MQGKFVRATTLQFWHGTGATSQTMFVGLIDKQGRFLDWVGEAWTTLANMLLNDVTNWETAGFSAAMTEQQDGDTNLTAIYIKSTSAIAAITPDDYTAIALDGASIANDRTMQEMHWDGTYWTPLQFGSLQVGKAYDWITANGTLATTIEE